MYCKKCGKELEDGVSFCANCGQPVAGDLPTNEQKSKKPIIGVVILILIILVAVLVVALVFSLRNGDEAVDNITENEVTNTAGNGTNDVLEGGIADETMTTPENNSEGDVTKVPESGVADGEQGTPLPDAEPEKIIDPERLAALEESAAAYREYMDDKDNAELFEDVLGYRLVYVAGSDYPLCFIAKLDAFRTDAEIYYLSYLPTTSSVQYNDDLESMSDPIFDPNHYEITVTISYNEQTEYMQECYHLRSLLESVPTETYIYCVYKYSVDNGNFETVFTGDATNLEKGDFLGYMAYSMTLPVKGSNINEKQFDEFLNAYGEYTDSYTWEDMYGTFDEAVEAVASQ